MGRNVVSRAPHIAAPATVRKSCPANGDAGVSMRHLIWAIEQRLPPTQKIVLLDLADRCGEAGTCFPAVATIADRCMLCERTVQTTLAELAAKGLIDLIRRPGRGGRNLYRVRAGRISFSATDAPQADVDDDVDTPQTSVPDTPQMAAVSIDNLPSKRTTQESDSDLRSDAKPRVAKSLSLFGDDQPIEASATQPVMAKQSGAPPSIRSELWNQGVPILRRLTGIPDAKARALLGRLLREAKDDARQVLRSLVEAEDLQPADPVSWLTAAARHRGRKADRLAELREEFDLHGFVLPEGPNG